MPWIARFATGLLAVQLLQCLFFSAWAAVPVPPEAFGNMPAESDVVLSPDGRWLAWTDRTESKPRIVMFDLPGGKIQRVLAVPERVKVRDLQWSDGETLIITLSETTESKYSKDTSRENFRTIAADVSGGNSRMLPLRDPDFPNRKGNVIPAGLISIRASNPHTVVMATGYVCSCLLEVDTRTGKYTIIKNGNDYTTDWVVDRNGRPMAREDWDWRHHAYKLVALNGEKAKEILRKDDSEHPQIAGLLADGSAVVLLAANGRSHQAVWAIPLDGSTAKLIAEDPTADITNVFTDPYTGAIIGIYVSGSVSDVRWLEPPAQLRQDVLQRAFPGRHVHVYGWSADGTKTLASVETPSSPPIYYVVDFSTHRADIAGEEYPALAGVPLGQVKEISYKARDGTSIPGYLTLPATKTAEPIPLVVFPHGGPQSRDYLEFNWLAQFLASRGYAVLQPQFRGSTGFGDAFREAGYRQWGGLMQDDVTDGVHAMIDQGIADPHRICIVGASYGGYAALAGAAFTPDLYSCAVSIAGVSDLPALMREEVPLYEGTISNSMSDWKAHIGGPNDSNLATKSPINAVKAIKIPILIVYGTGDSVVPTAQSEKMAQALKSAGKSVSVAVLPGEDHWLSRTETRVQVLKELEAFLRLHL
jgi:dipeptidyl aminopeptidase/acylaminoacyl peptidase